MKTLMTAAKKKMRSRCLILLRGFWPQHVRMILGANSRRLGKDTRAVTEKEIALLQCKYRL